MRKVLVADRVHPFLIKKLDEKFDLVDYIPDINYDKTLACISEYFGIIINSKTIANKSFLDQASLLKFIGRLGSGLEIIDLDYAASKGVKVYNSPEGNRNAVAEHAVGMLLSLFNKLHLADEEVKKFDWNRERNRGLELEGKTIGIIGYGNTGSQLAKRLSCWDMEILAYDKYKSDFASASVKEVDMEQLFALSDIISFHLPLTPETNGLVNETFIKRIHNDVYLVNTSRGKIIETNALLSGLRSGKIKGACLDVFENEKVETMTENERNLYSELYSFQNVILSPHVAGWTQESLLKIAKTLIEKINKDF